MFGEFGLYCDGKLFGLVCDDELYLKPTGAGRAVAGDLAEASPYPGAKPQLVVPGDRLDESAWLTDLVRVTVAALPARGSRGRPADDGRSRSGNPGRDPARPRKRSRP